MQQRCRRQQQPQRQKYHFHRQCHQQQHQQEKCQRHEDSVRTKMMGAEAARQVQAINRCFDRLKNPESKLLAKAQGYVGSWGSWFHAAELEVKACRLLFSWSGDGRDRQACTEASRSLSPPPAFQMRWTFGNAASPVPKQIAS